MTLIETEFSRIDAKLIIPGRGEPIPDGALVHSGGSIDFVGASVDIPHKFKSLKPVRVNVLMPGMWDCHVHFFGTKKYSLDTYMDTKQAVAGIRAARDAVATLNAGFTSVRELAGYGVELAEVINEGWLPGPNIYSSVSILSQTAGHGDTRGVSACELHDRIEHGLPAYVCDGVSECIKAVRTQIRRGASVIKIAATGGAISGGDDVNMQQFSDEEIKAMVDEAGRNGLAVAAHCHAKAGVKAALDAGCLTIEHGTFLDDELVKQMVEKDAILVATRGVLEYSISVPENWSPEQYEQLLAIKKNHAQSYKRAIEGGVRCALGTDLGVSAAGAPWNHGMGGVEFKYAVEAGMSPLQAIEAGTAAAPATLGPKAPKSGQLLAGYDADFIALAENPLEDISILSDPDKVIHVWKKGLLYKANGRPINMLVDAVLDPQ